MHTNRKQNMTAHHIAMNAAAIRGWALPEQEHLLEDRLSNYVFARRYQESYDAAVAHGFSAK